jgi:hypothetical protein
METSGPHQKKLTPIRGRGAGVSPAITDVIILLYIIHDTAKGDASLQLRQLASYLGTPTGNIR